MIRRFFSSLRVRLLVLVLLAVVPVLALTLYSGLEERQREMAEAREAALHMARHFSLGQEQLFQTTGQLLAALARLQRVRGSDHDTCGAYLRSGLGDYRLYLNLAVVDLRGNVTCSALKTNRPVNVADRPYFRRVVETGDFVIGEYQIGRITGKATLNLAYPLKDGSGHVQGLLFAALGLVRLSQLEFQPRSDLPQARRSP